MLGKRLLSAVVLIPIVVAAVYLGGYPLWVFGLVVGFLAGYEYVKLLTNHKLNPSWLFTLSIIILFVLDSPPLELHMVSWGMPLITLAALAAEINHHNREGSLYSWALAIAGGIYIGFPIGTILKLRMFDQGLYWILIALAGTWICDSAAYFVGSRWGKRRFFPAISPKKTWEGAWAGIIVGSMSIIPFAILVLKLAWWWAAIAALVIVVASTFGDLAESVIKRQMNVKDSSNLIPGHGGVLDRIDSLLYVMPLVYLIASLVKYLA
ncbi:MAG: phosphatidate cytidylyltransferase [Chloroflexi bacterium]|nr:phosphatidate cytidylyltransferase [Chloroflexota bacterium]